MYYCSKPNFISSAAASSQNEEHILLKLVLQATNSLRAPELPEIASFHCQVEQRTKNEFSPLKGSLQKNSGYSIY